MKKRISCQRGLPQQFSFVKISKMRTVDFRLSLFQTRAHGYAGTRLCRERQRTVN
jgi:hypothetical protein